MLYTEDFSMRHYVGFSQIGSHMMIESLTVVQAQLGEELIREETNYHTLQTDGTTKYGEHFTIIIIIIIIIYLAAVTYNQVQPLRINYLAR